MTKKVKNFAKGQLVYKIARYGSNAGKMDEERLYKIRSIGTRQCTIDRVNKDTGEPYLKGLRGENLYIYTKEEADERSAMGYHLTPYDWCQVFVPCGEPGWDPSFNY